MTNYLVAILCSFIGWCMIWGRDPSKSLIGCIFLGFSIAFIAIQCADDFKHSATKEQISELAKKKWQDAGQPKGRDEEFWLAAERELNG